MPLVSTATACEQLSQKRSFAWDQGEFAELAGLKLLAAPAQLSYSTLTVHCAAERSLCVSS